MFRSEKIAEVGPLGFIPKEGFQGAWRTPPTEKGYMNLQSKYKISRDENHAYTVDTGIGVVTLPGVTGILDIIGSKDKTNRLMGWAKKHALLKVAEHLRTFSGKQLIVDEAWIEAVRKSAWKRDKEMLKEAGDIGTRVHAAIDSFILGQEPKLDADTKQGYDNFISWLNKSQIKLIMGDTYVANLDLEYGGAVDAIGEKDGHLILLDWKTSNYLKDENALQAAAYVLAFEKTFNTKISQSFVIRFGKEIAGDIEPKEINIDVAANAFRRALQLKSAMGPLIWEVE